MPNVADSELILVGTVIARKQNLDYETKQPDGSWQITVMTEQGGFSIVKVQADDYNLVRPGQGESVAWYCRPAPWRMPNGNAGMSNSFVRIVTADDLESLAATVSVSA